MKQRKKLLSLLLAAALCIGPMCGTVGAASLEQPSPHTGLAAAENPQAEPVQTSQEGTSSTARMAVGLNGASGKWSEFDQSVYDLVTDHDQITGAGFVWPSKGKILVLEAASNTFYLIHRYDGFTIPAGVVVDLYRYSTIYDSYAMQAHFDTTDGKPYTISNYTTNLGAPATHDSRRGTAWRTFTPNVPAENYSNSYRDVDSSAWYYDAVMTLTEGGMFNGYGDGTFGPDDPMTRAQVMTIVGRLHNHDLSSYYTDTGTASRGFAASVLGDAISYGSFVYPTTYELSLLLRETDYVPGLILDISTYDPEKKDYVKGLAPGYDPDWAWVRMQQCIYDNWLASDSKNVSYRYTIEEFPDSNAIHQWSSANVKLMRETLYKSSSIRDSEIPGSCEAYILRAWNLGMFTGVDSAGSFNADAPLTRAQFCRVLYNMGWTYYGCLDYNSITTSGWAWKR